MHNPIQAHEVAMLAAQYAGESHKHGSNVAAKVSDAYIAAYKAVMTHCEPKVQKFSGQAAGLGSSSVGWAVNRPMFVHADGRLHAYPEHACQTGTQG